MNNKCKLTEKKLFTVVLYNCVTRHNMLSV